MKFLLSVIAVCLVMITSKLYIPEAHAEVGGMDYIDLQYDDDFTNAVKGVVSMACNINVSTYADVDGDTVWLNFYKNVDCI